MGSFIPTIYEDIEVEKNELISIPSQNMDNFNNVEDHKSFFDTALKIASDFYGDVKLSRYHAQRILNIFDSTINSHFVNILMQLIRQSFDKSVVKDIVNRISDIQTSFKRLNTEYKCFAELRKRDCLIDPETVTFGYREEISAGIIKYKKNTAAVIPISQVLKKSFEMPNVLEKTLEYTTSLNSDGNAISNIIQTDFWKAKSGELDNIRHLNDSSNNKVPSKINGIVLPIFLYEDAFEAGNPLGSHAIIYKMSGMYISLPALPPEYRSK